MGDAPLLREIADRCLLALSPYDCRRHYAHLAGRGSECGDAGPDLFARLRSEQQAAVQRGVADAVTRVDAERAALTEIPAAFSTSRRAMECGGAAFRRSVWRGRATASYRRKKNRSGYPERVSVVEADSP